MTSSTLITSNEEPMDKSKSLQSCSFTIEQILKVEQKKAPEPEADSNVPNHPFQMEHQNRFLNPWLMDLLNKFSTETKCLMPNELKTTNQIVFDVLSMFWI